MLRSSAHALRSPAFASALPLLLRRSTLSHTPLHAPTVVRIAHRPSVRAQMGSAAAAADAPRRRKLEESPLLQAAASARRAAESDDAPGASSQGESDGSVKYRGEVFCNRALNMARIQAVGFDMDYTIAMYYSERFESLSCAGAVEKLVDDLGYPEELLGVKYDHELFIRGLVVDKERGNILKLDRHKYVKRAFHGFTEMTKEERTSLYTEEAGIFTFLEPGFSLLDTLFSLPDAFLFSACVDHKDKNPGSIEQSYDQIYKDVRQSVDMCHRDGSIKDIVSNEPGVYIQKTPEVFSMVREIRQTGRKVFLLTNSFWDYTDVVMKYLYSISDGGGGGDDDSGWTTEFDLIISGACKPAFIVDAGRPLYRCDIATGALANTDSPHWESREDYLAREGTSFQGGNYTHLHDLLGVINGSQVLYVGDHIYSDIVRSKRTLGWRTLLIIPELEAEVDKLHDPEIIALTESIDTKRRKRDELDEWIDRLRLGILRSGKDETAKRAAAEEEVARAMDQVHVAREDILKDVEALHMAFHPTWGQMFKSGPQNSRFAEQVENYACLYSGKATNLQLVCPDFYYRAMPDLMPHDRFEDSPMARLLAARRDKLGEGHTPVSLE